MISDIIILVLPIIVVLAIWMFRILEQRLPEKQRAVLDHFVYIAVIDAAVEAAVWEISQVAKSTGGRHD